MTLNPGINPRSLPNPERDYSAWYNDVIRQGGLIDEGLSQGVWALLPNATRLWNNIRSEMTCDMDSLGIEEVTLQTLFPYSLLASEKDHIEGFAPEVFQIDRAGQKVLDDPLVLRPTSEVVVAEYFKRWATSYRDLPLLINQWGSVFRNEKRPRPFLRTSEFLWQEGHSAHASPEDAVIHAKSMADFYATFLARKLAIFSFQGEKSKNERFAGAYNTYTLEAILGGKALQMATAHNLGDTFSVAQDIRVTGPNNEADLIYQTSWGSSTRMIGAIVMMHGDNKGLVLPPKIAPTQAAFIPAWKSDADRSSVLSVTEALVADINIRSSVIKRDHGERLGAARFKEEKMGTPLQIIIGNQEITAQKATVYIRHSNESMSISFSDLKIMLPRLLESIGEAMLAKSEASQRSKIVEVASESDLIDAVDAGNFGFAGWTGDSQSEKMLKDRTGITIRLQKTDDSELMPDPLNGKLGTPTLFAKSY